MLTSARLDISEEHRRATRPASTMAELDAVLNGMELGLLTFDADLSVIFSNASLADVLETSSAALARAETVLQVLEASRHLTTASVQHVHEACLAAVGAAATRRVTLGVASRDGSRAFSVQIGLLHNGHWLAVFEETTARRAAEASALETAMSDPLTGLPSRQQFERRVADFLAGVPNLGWPDPAVACAQPAVILIDLDRFKAVNDTLGHPIGDALLHLVAKRLCSLVHQGDVVARLGGDEFAILVHAPEPSASAEEGLIALGQRIVDVLGRPYLIGGHLVNIGASVGVAVAPHDGITHDELLRNADLAMYDAKNAGRGAYRFFASAMGDRARARRSLEIDLRKAMVLSEFELHYQPQIDLETSAIEGFEALLRWRHPERGLVSPADFIPLAEETGLIVALGEWVIREACTEAMRWPPAIGIAVNVSPHQFENAGRLVDVISRSLALSGLPGPRLEIEITEGVMLRNDPSVLAALHRIRDMGVRVAMDDFGTGYSSLSQLHSFPFDKIKIDRSFVSGSADIAGQNAIIRAITALGVSLGMVTIAEGVETSEQLARIRTQGCTSVQGYLFSRPVPVDQLDGLIAGFARTHASAVP